MRQVFILLFAAPFASVALAQEDSCGIVLERAAANIQYRFGSATSASTQANALCDERYEKMSSSEQQSIDAQYKVFAGSYSAAGSNLKEYRTKYCSAGTSSFFGASQSTEYSSQVYEASVAAWRDCKAMQQAYVNIAPARTPDDRSVTVSISYRGPGTARLTGVRLSPESAFTCRADGGAQLNGAASISLSGNTFSFDCTRVVTSGQGPGQFSADASSITITTSATTRPFMLYFPAVASPDIRSENAATLDSSIKQLRSALEALEARATKLAVGTKFVVSPTDTCPDGWSRVANLLVGVQPGANVSSFGFVYGNSSEAASPRLGAFPTMHPMLCVRS